MRPLPEKEREAVARMYETYKQSVYRLCLIYLKDRSLAEDAMQDTFLKALRAYPGFRGDCAEKTWLVRIGINVCRDYQRTAWLRHNRKGVSLDDIVDTLPAEPAYRADADVVQAVAHLPQKLKEVILTRYYERLTLEETAAALGLSLSAVNTRIRKAKTLLKKELAEVYFDE